ncbi:hypothetical protein B0A79_21625 [Flavobacterium piscis]|uniref:Uncharacterized protein n=1 Tax=Flavobacterium piscis TaxID=1114874 RepID=A0ABX2XIM2_9FLAO|nr:hypothetical protein FLP_12570 [Flavobacterium piscis]OXE97533.1 hypothetical protein B0A79_21625 [Flavobacterium piscis]
MISKKILIYFFTIPIYFYKKIRIEKQRLQFIAYLILQNRMLQDGNLAFRRYFYDNKTFNLKSLS